MSAVLQGVCETRGIVYADYKVTLVTGAELDQENLTLGDLYTQFGTQEVLLMPIPKASVKFIIYFDKSMERKKVVPYKYVLPKPTRANFIQRENEKLEDVLQKVAQVRGISYEDQLTTLPDGTELNPANYTLGDIYQQFALQEVFFVEIPKSTCNGDSKLNSSSFFATRSRARLCRLERRSRKSKKSTQQP